LGKRYNSAVTGGGKRGGRFCPVWRRDFGVRFGVLLLAAPRKRSENLFDIRLACYTNPWGNLGFVNAIDDIAACGFVGVEYAAAMTRGYYDRLHVFQEIHERAKLVVANLLQEVDLLEVEDRDEQVEAAMKGARFISAAGAKTMTVCHNQVRAAPLSDEEWKTAAAILEEIGERVNVEFGLQLCYMPRNSRLVFQQKDLLRLLSMTDDQFVKLAFDTAEITLAGSAPKKFIADPCIYKRIGIFRFHDVSGAKRRAKFTSDDPNGTAPQFGRGAVDFAEISRELMKREYQGWVTLDITGAATPPLVATQSAYRYSANQ
jgi:sugar phosphate isomerase/epimerase